MMTYHLHLTGLVQGVGFRPFVWQLAKTLQLTGTVCNGVDGVHILFNADAHMASYFQERIHNEAPLLAHIESAVLNLVERQEFPDFSIVESGASGKPNVLLTPDIGLCANCRTELTDPSSRRYGYAFTTCTHCGPRYSILQQIPYDRQTTTMASFAMCSACREEYENPADRRYYAQTNSCPGCAIELTLFDSRQQSIVAPTSQPIALVSQALTKGSIVAVKGIGGYLLLCDATNPDAIANLRRRKHRPTKPLAVLYPNRAILEADCVVEDDEWALLSSPTAPIVLLRQRNEPASGIAVDQLAPGLSLLGVMLPYAPLLELLAHTFNKPIVATSGNLSGSPICYTDEQAIHQLSPIADFILLNNRPIVIPQDDSVIRLTRTSRQPIIIRRSRGLAPTFSPSLDQQDTNVLALGASLKSTFAWQLRGNTYVSQYLGDLESFDTQQHFRHTLNHFRTLFDTTPDVLVTDAHEGYFSTQLAHNLSVSWNVPVLVVQHHEAHLAAVLAENNVIRSADPILGVIWDGTGYGSDGHIWGGEFFRYQADADIPFVRIAHFAYFNALLGDKMPREPRLSALSLAYAHPASDALLKRKFSAAEWSLHQKLRSKNHLKTSSVGRLFDAVACLLGLIDVANYEGEAAQRLEEAATRYVDQYGFALTRHYLPSLWSADNVPTGAIISRLVDDILADIPTDQIAATFHHTLVRVVATIANQTGINKLAFSGGVFQNALLVDWLQHSLGPTYSLYFHHRLSPNDECISLGQLAHFSQHQTTHQTNQDHVLSYSWQNQIH